MPARLWLGGVIRQHRDRRVITELVRRIPACAKSFALLVGVDGLASYVTAFLRVCRYAVRTGRRGRPRWAVEPGLLIGHVVKRDAKRRGVGVVHRVVRGTAQAISAVLSQTPTGLVINTAYIERLNAPFRSALAPLGRRGRALAQVETTLTAGMYVVGGAYTFCWGHRRLRWRAGEGASRQWQERTPALVAGLTDHPWTMAELLRYQVPLPPWGSPHRRGRPPNRVQPPLRVGAA